MTEAELAQQTGPLIILGEPGMGKTHLLEWLARTENYAFCSARKLINRHDPKTLLGDASSLVIDALDEVSSRKAGDAVDQVIRRLGELNYPRFVLSCRVADWRSATAMESIREQYEGDNAPVELHIEPFTEEDANTFLEYRLGAALSRSVAKHFQSRGLSEFLGNPQTLELIVDVAGKGPLPENKTELFARAVDVLRIETSDSRADAQLPPGVALDAAGAAFAALILTGSEAIVRIAEANHVEGELSIALLRELPSGEHVDEVLKTRLFKSFGTDRFSYWHRRIGEFLGARWLAKHAVTNRKKRRVLALFHSYGLVPASLRGMHAWLAFDPALSGAVIREDPMGLIEYGDADNLTSTQGRILLDALKMLANGNPDFRDRETHSAKGLVHPALIEELRPLITDPATPFRLQTLVLDALRTAPTARHLEPELRALLLNQHASFASRIGAAEVMSELPQVRDWQNIVNSLHAQGGEMTLRLAIETMDTVGYQSFDDEVISKVAVAFAKSQRRIHGVLDRLCRNLPDARLNDVLDHCSAAIRSTGDPDGDVNNQELAGLIYQLVIRRLETGGVDPATLWRWIQPLKPSGGGDKRSREKFTDLLQHQTALRRAMLSHVLLLTNSENTVYGRYWQLAERSAGFAATTGDVIALLGELDPSDRHDERWRDIVQLVPHSIEAGADVRQAAAPFATGDSERTDWIARLTEPRVYEWQVAQALRDKKHSDEQRERNNQLRHEFMSRLEPIRLGAYEAVVDLAMAYIGIYQDIGVDDVPAHEKIFVWLGGEVDVAAKAGFEAFLLAVPPNPTASELASSYAQRRTWDAGYILVAALAERSRLGKGYADLSDERMIAGHFVLRHSQVAQHAGIEALNESVQKEVYDRGLWEIAMRQYIEPQLAMRNTFVDGLFSFMRDVAIKSEPIATALAIEWLAKYDDTPSEPEAELIDKLLRTGKFEELKALYGTRTDLIDNARKLNWVAVGVLVDFEAMTAKLSAAVIEPALLWHFRDRAGGGHNDHLMKLDLAQLEWLVTVFRSKWPLTSYPNNVRVGRNNPWDASDFLQTVIRRLGTDCSDLATKALRRLDSVQADGYSPVIKAVTAEQTRARVESNYLPPTLAAVEAILSDAAPSSSRDLLAFMIEELTVVESKIRSDDADSWRGFFDDSGSPHNEERCRDHLLGLLRQSSHDVAFEPETHVANDKEVDITCTTGPLRLPIEIKGQWHRQLWLAADAQLDKLYTPDWRASGYGIYLVLWFGDQVSVTKKLSRPPRGIPAPRTSAELRDILVSSSQSASDGRVAVIVLDLARINQNRP